MAHKLFIWILVSIFITGCGGKDKSPVVIDIGGIEVTADEFESLFKKSFLGREDSPASRKAFLDNLVTTKLILKEAERLRLDRDAQFLEDVEFFWQQSLLKLMLDRKMRELSLNVRIPEWEVSSYYRKRKDTDFQGKELSEVRGQIQWVILNGRESEAIQAWTDSLKEKTDIRIDHESLKISKE